MAISQSLRDVRRKPGVAAFLTIVTKGYVQQISYPCILTSGSRGINRLKRAVPVDGDYQQIIHAKPLGVSLRTIPKSTNSTCRAMVCKLAVEFGSAVEATVPLLAPRVFGRQHLADDSVADHSVNLFAAKRAVLDQSIGQCRYHTQVGPDQRFGFGLRVSQEGINRARRSANDRRERGLQ
jgi:hypothetical protein